MRWVVFAIHFVAFWLGLGCLCDTVQAQDHGICVNGSVSDTQEKLAYASVFLLENGIFRYGAHTDLKGNFVLHDVEPGQYSLVVSWAGLIQLERAEFSIPDGSNYILDIVIPQLEVPASAEIAETMEKAPATKPGKKGWPSWLRRNRRTADSSPGGWLAHAKNRIAEEGGMWNWVTKRKWALESTH